MINETLRQFDDIHTHVSGNPRAICSLSPKDATALARTDAPQPYSIMLHPWHLDESSLSEFASAVATCASDSRFIAIGECGLDTECTTPIELQEQCLETALHIARQYHKPVILHIVRSWDRLIKITRKVFGAKGAVTADSEGCRLIIHGFRKNLTLAQQLADQGYYISLGRKYNPAVLSGLDNDKIYRETDDSAI